MASSAPSAPSGSNVQELRGPPGQGRLAELLGSFPLVTLAVTALCLCVYVACNLAPDFGSAVGAAAIVPALVVGDLQLYRLVTCAFTHLSALHIGMNMVSLFGLGSSLEGLFGSLHFLFLLLAYVLLCGALYLPLAFLELLVYSPAAFFGSAAGFSGVLFALAVDESALSTAPTRSVFGLFSVPTRLYPWALMLAISLAVPGVSLLGHLAGILVGGAHVAGWLGWLLPSLPTLRKLEESPWLRPLVRLRGYRLVPAADPVIVHNEAGGASALAFAAYALAPLTQCLGGLVGRLRGGGAGGGGGGGGGGSGAGGTAPRAPVAASPRAAAAPAAAAAADLEAGAAARPGVWGALSAIAGSGGKIGRAHV